MKSWRMVGGVLVAATLALAAVGGRVPERDGDGSPVAIATSGAQLFVVERGTRLLHVVDRVDRRLVGSCALAAEPTGLAVLPDGRLAVTVDRPRGELLLIDPKGPTVQRRVPLGHSPCAPTPSPDGRQLWFCDRFADQVGCVDLRTGRAVAVMSAGREPIASVLTEDGASLLVVTHLPDGPADHAESAGEMLWIDTAARRVRARAALPDGGIGARAIGLSSDGRYAFVPHVLARYHHPATQLERGWVNTNALTLFDVADAGVYATVLLDSPQLGAANPWGVACAEDGGWVAVTLAGCHQLLVIDLPGLLAKLAAPGQPEVPVVDDLTFLTGLHSRIELGVLGPRAIAVAVDEVWVAPYFERVVSGLRPGLGGTAEVTLGPVEERSAERRGELLFHDARRCFQRWQSCASCHPDGRADALNWDLLNDGFGNPKNTKSLLLAHQTPPTTALGVRPDAETSVRSGLRHIHFTPVVEAEAAAIDAWLRALQPRDAPAQEPAAVARGQGLFSGLGCAVCHPGPRYTDQLRHQLGTATGLDVGRPIDTPTLVECWRTRPYLHDGRAADLEQLLGTQAHGRSHPAHRALSSADLADLCAFVRTL